MKFDRIVCVDRTKLQPWAIKELQKHSRHEIEVYNDYPASQEEILNRTKDADAVLVSWHTQLDEEILEKSKNLKYIGMACSLYDDASANVAVKYARSRGIVVKGIRDYGDPGVVEFIVSELVRLLHGLGKNQWRDMPVELTEKRIGIIGLGVTGQLLAKCLLPFGPNIFYFSRTRKKEWEEKGIKYLPLNELLEQVDVVSLHLPKNTGLLEKQHFDRFGIGKILINTSLGLAFDQDDFKAWIKKEGNFAIFDGDGKKELSEEIEDLPNIIAADKSAGWAAETERRLSKKVVENVESYFNRT